MCSSDLLVKAFRFSDKFEPGTNLRAWLSTILHNTWRNRVRDAGREAVEVDSTRLEEAETTALRERLAGMTGGHVDLDTQVDPAILGGVMVRLGDRLIDGSVRGRLERLRTRLASGAL